MATTLENAQRLVMLFDQMRRASQPTVFSEIGHLNLSLTHMHTLRLLGLQGEMSMKELAEQLKIKPPSVTAVTRRLVQSDLVQRLPHPDDSRVVLVSLTERGRSLYCRFGQGHIQQMSLLLQGLSEQEQEQFLDLLERAVTAMRSQADMTQAALDEERPTTTEPTTLRAS